MKGATDIAYRVEVSNGLVDWQFGSGVIEEIVTSEEATTQTIKATSLLPPVAGQGQFMRLRVTRQ